MSDMRKGDENKNVKKYPSRIQVTDNFPSCQKNRAYCNWKTE